MPDAAPAIAMHNVARRVPGQGGHPVELLADIHFTLDRGDRLHVLGPSGAGKSTLVRLINRLDEPSDGTVHVFGKPLTNWPLRDLRRRVGIVFQEPSLVGLDVRANLRLPFELIKALPEDLDHRMEAALKLAGLDGDMLTRRADELSVGQKQRVTLARTLINEPDILILDEPTSSLDPQTAAGLLDGVADAADQQSLTLVMVTHRLSEARRLGGKLAVLIQGKLRAFGQIDDLLNNPPDDDVAQFLHGAKDE